MGTRDKIRLCCHQSTTPVCGLELLAELLTQNSKGIRGQVGSFSGCASAQVSQDINHLCRDARTFHF